MPKSKYCEEEGCDCNGCESNDLHICPCADAQPTGFLKGDLNDFFEEKAKQLARSMQHRMQQLENQGWPTEAVVNIASLELSEDRLPKSQNQTYENRLDECNQKGVITCPRPDCFYAHLCIIRSKEMKK